MSDTIPKLTKEDGQSKDLVNENIEKLKQLFPEIVTDGKVDFDTLKEELGEFAEESDERYSFTWNGKSKARKLAMEPSRGTLRPAPEESVNWDSTEHLFIEGDNLEVLKLLQRSYHKRVKMIYIDPPYNTGNDFVYNDDYKDNLSNYLKLTGQLDGEGKKISSNPEYSGRYHTDWLNMMYPRLKLARELLREDGFIFISIDDIEQAQLRKIADQVFGEENFLGQIVWKNSSRTSDRIAVEHEYILCFAKNSQILEEPWGKPRDEAVILNKYVESLKENKTLEEASKLLSQKISKLIEESDNEKSLKWLTNYKNLDENWNIYYAVDLSGEGSGPARYFGDQLVPAPEGRHWMSQEYINQLYEDNRIVWRGERAYRKLYIEESTSSLKSIVEIPTRRGTEYLKELLGKDVFDKPKPADLISMIIEYSTSGGDLILDFFAGSSTTAESVFRSYLNDKEVRRFIMVQWPEPITDEEKNQSTIEFCRDNVLDKNISEIAKERIRRDIKNIDEKYPNYDGDLGFKVFKLDTSNIKPWDPSFDEVQLSIEDSIENVKPDRSEKDLLYEVLLKYGIDLSLPIEEREIANAKVYVGGAGALVLCPSDTITLDVVEGIAEIKEEFDPEIMRVVFRDSGFKDDMVKTNAIQILKQHGIEDVRSI